MLSSDEERADAPLMLDSSVDGPSPKLGSNTFWHRFIAFLDGPTPRIPPKQRIYLPGIQKRLGHVVESLGTSMRIKSFWLIFYVLWFAIFSSCVYKSSFSAEGSVKGQAPEFLSCVSTLWRPKNGCGLDARNCEPFTNTTIEFRCPADCITEVVLNNRPIGDQEVIHIPFVVGGQGATDDRSGYYRGDSFVCAAAIHAGVISNTGGGCGRLETTGNQEYFESSTRHGITSIAFDSEFPKSFVFKKLDHAGGCTDLRWPITAVSAIITVVYALLQNNALIFYWVTYISTYMHIALVSDPPPRTSYDLLGLAFEGLLPSLFVGYTFWRCAVRWTLVKALPLDRTVFWVGGLWFGALLNYISAFIPISRLLLSDIMRDGGLFYFIAIVLLLLAIVVGQMALMRKAGDLIYYLKIYLTGLAVLILLGNIPGLVLRIHHYIFGLLFIAGTAYPTRLCMLYQGILIGLFLDGIARWGFDSILETAEHLREDAVLLSPIPSIPSVGNWLETGFLAWEGIPPANYYFSVLINEVERYRGPARTLDARNLDLLDNTPYYMRVAYAFGQSALDSTKAAVFYSNGTFISPGPGRTAK